MATKTIYANPPADGSSYDYTLVFCHVSLLLKQNPVGEIIFLSFIDDKNISFLSCINDKVATLSAQERGLQAQNTYKRRQISPFGVRKPVFCVEARPFEATPGYTGCFQRNSYVSKSYASFA